MESGGVQSSGPLVLIIDDDDDLRKVLAAMLAWFGYRTWSSADGGEALDMPGLAQVQFAFVDLHLAIQDGRALADRLADRGIPVMLMSGDRRVASGATTRHPFLPKPFDMDRVKSLLESHGVFPMNSALVEKSDPASEVNPPLKVRCSHIDLAHGAWRCGEERTVECTAADSGEAVQVEVACD